jgi:hypothetical protein
MKFAFVLLAFSAAASAAEGAEFRRGTLLYSDDFAAGLSRWTAELEKPGVVTAAAGKLTLDVPAGCTVWFRPELSGPVLIEYEATMIQAGGANDRVSDLNAFWMATDARSPGNLFATKRSGKFADYNQLRTYYVGQGGNGNTTTRFRRYIGDTELRPLLPEHDLHGPDVLLEPNVSQAVQLVAFGERIQYYRDGVRIFDFRDPEPYTRGRFAFRTTYSHIEIRNFRVYRLIHSSRKATVGSRPAARRAGSQDAMAVIAKKTTATAAKVGGSVAVTPTSMLVMARVNPSAAATPTATPTALSRIP